MNDPFLEARHLELADKARALGDRRLRSAVEDERTPRGGRSRSSAFWHGPASWAPR